MAKLKTKARFAQFWRDWWGLIAVALLLLTIGILFGVAVWSRWIETGFSQYTPPAPETRRAKTLWDWMELLLVPLILATGAALFSWVTNKRASENEERRVKEQREIEERRARKQREIEEDRARETAFQTYLDRMTELIKDGLLESEEADAKRSIARARTLTALRQLDGVRRGLLVIFLYDSALIHNGTILRLHGASLWNVALGGSNLEAADLSRTEMRGAYLVGSNLRKSSFEHADLHGADFRMADLSSANLHAASLWGADLSWSNLSGADLSGANLRLANLKGADLSQAQLVQAYLSAADFLDANLEGVILEEADLHGNTQPGYGLGAAKVTAEQLDQAASLKGATMPDGTVHE